jgi:glycosyltransferase involved in cell wall biosynthesis
MSLPRAISVVIPTFDRAALLAEAIDSVLSQPGFDWQIVVANDGSTDATSELIHAMVDEGHPVWPVEHTENRGVSTARNSALSVASMPLIAFLDSDDLMLPGSFETLWRILDDDPGLDVARGQHLEVELVPGSVSYALALTLPPNALGMSGTLIRDRLVKATGPFIEQLSRAEDTEWFSRIPDLEQRMGVAETITMHRRHAHDNLTGDPQAQREARLAWVRSRLSQRGRD